MTRHSSFPKGSKIFIRMIDGTEIIDHFEEKKSDRIFLRSGDKILLKDIKSTGFYKDRSVSVPNRNTLDTENLSCECDMCNGVCGNDHKS